MPVDDWFLSAPERGNRHTRVDAVHPGSRAWSTANHVRPIVHGRAYFAELASRVARLAAGDRLYFAGWRGDPGELLTDEPGSEVSRVFADAARRGVEVRGLIWRSHPDAISFSAGPNRRLCQEIEAAGGRCLLDMRVRAGGSHHQKLVVLRHAGRSEQDIAYLGGIDLGRGRRDDGDHAGDPQALPIAGAYGARPPWHDVQLAITGPAVYDVEVTFRERWLDPSALSRNPFHWVEDKLRGIVRTAGPLAVQSPPPPPVAGGTHSVQLLRTYPHRLRGYPFAPDGERSIALAYARVIARARHLIYVEDQYLWSREVATTLADALRANPDLRVIVVLPHHPDQEGRLSGPPQLVGRQRAMSLIRAAGGGRVAFYGVENRWGRPVYVHAKVCVVDDVWASVGSDNFNRRSWTYDSELSAAVWDDADGDGSPYALNLRLTLAREHLDAAGADACALADPRALFEAYASSASTLQRWHDAGRLGGRPPGRLRPLAEPSLGAWTTRWATVVYHHLYDPMAGRMPCPAAQSAGSPALHPQGHPARRNR